MVDDIQVEQLEDRVDSIADIAIAADERAEALEDDHEDFKTEIRRELAAIRDEIEDLKERTDPLQWSQQAKAMESEEKAAVCLMTLYERAQNNNGRAELDAEGAENTLGGAIHRTSAYDVLRKAAQLVDDEDVCWFQKEARSSPDNSRLVVNLNKGELPRTVAGYTIREGEPA